VSLEDLARAPKAGASGFVPQEIGRSGVEKDGYRFTVVRSRADGVTDVATAAATCNGSAPAGASFASAEPIDKGKGDAAALPKRADDPHSGPASPNPVGR
jgi:hypothetical protein